MLETFGTFIHGTAVLVTLGGDSNMDSGDGCDIIAGCGYDDCDLSVDRCYLNTGDGYRVDAGHM